MTHICTVLLSKDNDTSIWLAGPGVESGVTLAGSGAILLAGEEEEIAR